MPFVGVLYRATFCRFKLKAPCKMTLWHNVPGDLWRAKRLTVHRGKVPRVVRARRACAQRLLLLMAVVVRLGVLMPVGRTHLQRLAAGPPPCSCCCQIRLICATHVADRLPAQRLAQTANAQPTKPALVQQPWALEIVPHKCPVLHSKL